VDRDNTFHLLQNSGLFTTFTKLSLKHGGKVGRLLAEETLGELVLFGLVFAFDSNGDLRASVELEDPANCISKVPQILALETYELAKLSGGTS
jgi:hypothetical protein